MKKPVTEPRLPVFTIIYYYFKEKQKMIVSIVVGWLFTCVILSLLLLDLMAKREIVQSINELLICPWMWFCIQSVASWSL